MRDMSDLIKKAQEGDKDALEQMIIMGHGAIRLSANAFWDEIERVNALIQEELGE